MTPKHRAAGKRASILVVFLCCLIRGLSAQTPTTLATSKQIRDMLVQRVNVEHKAHAVVVGLISKRGREIISYGTFGPDDPRVPDGESIFEIGSVTKVFTTLLLSDMALRGEVKLNDPVSKYLPASVHVPTRNGKEITLLDLATHHSGLSRVPANYNHDYTLEQLYDFLSNYTLARNPGTKYEYSSFGVGLLGQVLALRAGTDYETLLRTRITGPLQMNHTAERLTPEMQATLVPGYAGESKAAGIEISALEAGGSIRSNVDDMLIFLAANMGLIRTPLQAAMKNMLKVRRESSPGAQIGLGWFIVNGGKLVCHNGGTYGYHAFVGFEPRRKVGIVVLSNSTEFTDDMAQQILDHPVSGPTEVQIGPPNLH